MATWIFHNLHYLVTKTEYTLVSSNLELEPDQTLSVLDGSRLVQEISQMATRGSIGQTLSIWEWEGVMLWAPDSLKMMGRPKEEKKPLFLRR